MTLRIDHTERGIALLHVVLLLAMVTAAAGGAATVTRIEIHISQFQRGERDAAYAAQAMLAAALQELDRTANWDSVLAGGTHAGFADGPNTVARQIPGAEVQIMQEVGHFPMSENPAQFRKYILPVLAEIS